ncbi:acyl-CoA thioesterase [Ketobacter sp. MCCC 1A13808]|uniref:acyl-CoA thioesterase n=1 Tax=Ketobacter sp. MCCC 1A13808 TaxID=2602738 RepID=UPI000F262D72|nr:acyl-CoA thioesterase [Ketobacter sp. MCCC 1A13808]MVF11489.1 acyl-CoA thioesterase [Ketobacter sp. MCCC 1A13808]RLP53302.1 MAG: acyl-CoA thioesterase [Ketobacter sp.]|tara:strand:- start:78 stop:521 length:444 start_codon:yes stop_codon:yes gene_type:complete
MPREHTIDMTVLVTPDMSNFGGKMHGGELLKLLDKVAYTCAMRYCGTYVVTLSVDKVLFKEPIAIGELVSLKAAVNYTGRTSMEVGIRVVAENLETGSVRHTNSCYFTMVAVDKAGAGKPTRVPPLVPSTDEEQRRWDEALQRRNTR